MSKIEAFWQDATADDVAKIANTRNPISARLRDSGKDGWEEGLLAGWKLRRSDVAWIDADGASWKQCQVYREPSWYANKPDPGPGWRLLGKFPDEEPQLGDSVFCPDSKRWLELEAGFDPGQLPTHWYRRRIEPEPKFAIGQTVRVVGPKARPARNWTAAMDEHIEQVYTIVSVQSYPGYSSGTADFYSVKGVVDWSFREDYLEPVEPEPKHYVLRVGDSCETPNGNRIKVISQDGTQSFVNFGVGDKVKTIHGQTITITEKGFEVTQ
jgi:hypothetical protein